MNWLASESAAMLATEAIPRNLRVRWPFYHFAPPISISGGRNLAAVISSVGLATRGA